jgi:hypothetical protein
MDVIINELKTTVRLADGETVLAPETLARITQVVLEAVKQNLEREDRRRDERRITAGSTSWMKR